MWHPLNNMVLRIQKSDVGLTNRFVVPNLKQNMNENILSYLCHNCYPELKFVYLHA